MLEISERSQECRVSSVGSERRRDEDCWRWGHSCHRTPSCLVGRRHLWPSIRVPILFVIMFSFNTEFGFYFNFYFLIKVNTFFLNDYRQRIYSPFDREVNGSLI